MPTIIDPNKTNSAGVKVAVDVNVGGAHTDIQEPKTGKLHEKTASYYARNDKLGSTIRDEEGIKGSLLKKWLEDKDKLYSDRQPGFVRKWVNRIHKLLTPTDPDSLFDRYERWSGIGWEVYERKALLLASASDLEQNQIADAFKLAATDIFVEKAQRILTMRGRILYSCGALTAGFALTILAYTTLRLVEADILTLLKVKSSTTQVSTAYLTMLILKSTTAGAFVIAIVYFLVSLSRALLHEGTVLYNRRHSLRFGRLYVYLQSGCLNREDLEKAFNWNTESSSAFMDIQADKVMRSPVMKVLDTLPETLRAVNEILKSREKQETGKGNKKEKE